MYVRKKKDKAAEHFKVPKKNYSGLHLPPLSGKGKDLLPVIGISKVVEVL